MIKRFIFLLVLFSIAFFIFRAINPEGAQKLVNKVNTLLGREIGTGLDIENSGNILTGMLQADVQLHGTGSSGLLVTGTTNEEVIISHSGNEIFGEEKMPPVKNQDLDKKSACAGEGQFANEALGYPAECCSGLLGFFTGQGMRLQVDPGQLCYDPNKGVPRCTTINMKEGRYSSDTLLILDDCETSPITTSSSQSKTTVPFSSKTTNTKKKTSTDEKAVQALINSLFK